MTKNEVIRMARESGAVVEVGLAPVFYDHAQLYRFAELVAQHERETCAKVALGSDESSVNTELLKHFQFLVEWLEYNKRDYPNRETIGSVIAKAERAKS